MSAGSTSSANGLRGAGKPMVALPERRSAARAAVFESTRSPGTPAAIRPAEDLRSAIDRGELSLRFDPIVDLKTRETVGFEALPHWQQPALGEISPARFVPIAERSPLTVAIGSWTMESVCHELDDWNASGLKVPPVNVSVSPRQLADPTFAAKMRSLVRRSQPAADGILLAISHPTGPESRDSAISRVGALRDLGFRVVLDDFCDGESAMSDLEEFAPSGFSIDGATIARLPDSVHALAIVEALISLGLALGLRVVAKGVATQEQADALSRLGCRHAQGRLLSQPLESDSMPAALRVGRVDQEAPEETMPLGIAASTLGVSVSTIRRWSDEKRLSMLRTRGGHRRLVRADVERERRRLFRGPVLRRAREPSDALPEAAALVTHRRVWLRDAAVRCIYVGPDHGWFATPAGQFELDRWLLALGSGLAEGNFEKVKRVTAALLSRAGDAGVPLPDRVALIDSVAQTVRLVLESEHIARAELPDWTSLARVLRRLALE
jgi:excisionase family DNA binding protein